MIIDYSYFRGEITIPQMNQPEVLNVVNAMISKYEPRFLKSLFGLSFYQEFEQGIDPVSGDMDQRWSDLLDGTIYTYNDKEYEWVGFSNSSKESPIANYVYSKLMEKDILYTTVTGTVKGKAENSMSANPIDKIVRAWNEMVEWNISLIEYLNRNTETYPEWIAKNPYCKNEELLTFRNSLGI